VASDERDRLRAIERVLGRKINVLPLDRSGINFQQEAPRPASRPQPAPRAQQSHRAHQGRGRSQGGQGRSGSSRRV
jgi:hypothetical protein